jgi:uncharacterized protein YkwD
MRRPTLILLFSAIVLTTTPLLPAKGQSSVENELFGYVNRGRRNQLALHSGLRAVGREHSEEMSQDGELNHNRAEQRIFSAEPDPNEQNGPPDDGFNGTWCENVAYVRGAPESEVAQRIYQGWTDSPSHNRCMNDERMNAAGIGLYFDGDKTYWATFESVVDETAPGGTSQTTAERTPEATPSATPEPPRTPSPTATAPPTPSPRPTPTPRHIPFLGTPAADSSDIATHVKGTGTHQITISSSRALAGPIIPSSKREDFGWLELGSTLGVIALAAELLRRLTRRRDRSETK